MKPLFHTIITPKGGKQYNNTRNIGGVDWTMNTVIGIEDSIYANPIGVVKYKKKGSILEPGDEVLVHFNVFRQYWGFTGELMEGAGKVDDDTFSVFDDQMVAYKRDGEWIMFEDYILVKPHDKERGQVVVGNNGLEKGEYIAFEPLSDWKVEIDEELYYIMTTKQVVLTLI